MFIRFSQDMCFISFLMQFIYEYNIIDYLSCAYALN